MGKPPGKKDPSKDQRGKYSEKSRGTEQVHLCVGASRSPRDHEDRYILMVLDNILGGSVSSRLFQELREERGAGLCHRLPLRGLYGYRALHGLCRDQPGEFYRVLKR